MKKKRSAWKLITLIVMIIAGAVGVTTLSACSCRSVIDEPVAYYGCPNSKRVKKLRLKKERNDA